MAYVIGVAEHFDRIEPAEGILYLVGLRAPLVALLLTVKTALKSSAAQVEGSDRGGQDFLEPPLFLPFVLPNRANFR